MDETTVYDGKYDDLLIEYAERIKREDSILSQTSLARALREEFKLSLIEARRIVDDFCERGVLQSYFGVGPYDEWLTAELEAARRENRGVQATALAKKLNRESPMGQTGKRRSKYQKHIQNAMGLADAIVVSPVLCTICTVSLLVIQAARLPPGFAKFGFASNFLQTDWATNTSSCCADALHCTSADVFPDALALRQPTQRLRGSITRRAPFRGSSLGIHSATDSLDQCSAAQSHFLAAKS